MWNKLPLKSLVVSVGVAVGAGSFALQGCNRPAATPVDGQEDPALESATPEAKPAPAEAPPAAPAQSVDAPELLARLASAENMLEWHEVHSVYREQGGGSPEVDTALAAREAELLAKSPALAISDAIELVFLNWKLDGESSAEGQPETFHATWLFKVKQPLPVGDDQELRLVLRGWFDKAHQQYFGADEKYFQLTYVPEPPAGEWEVGAYQRVDHKTYKKLPNLPYRLHTYFTKVRKTETGDWAPEGRYGEIADSGWNADLGGAEARAGD